MDPSCTDFLRHRMTFLTCDACGGGAWRVNYVDSHPSPLPLLCNASTKLCPLVYYCTAISKEYTRGLRHQLWHHAQYLGLHYGPLQSQHNCKGASFYGVIKCIFRSPIEYFCSMHLPFRKALGAIVCAQNQRNFLFTLWCNSGPFGIALAHYRSILIIRMI